MEKNQKLGDEVMDTISNFKGKLTGRIEYLNGCIQYCVTPSVDKDGKIVKDEWFDYTQLELIKPEKTSIVKSKPSRSVGGPQRNCPS